MTAVELRRIDAARNMAGRDRRRLQYRLRRRRARNR